MKKIVFALLLAFLSSSIFAQIEPILVLDNVKKYEISNNLNFDLYKAFSKKELNSASPSIIKAFESINEKNFEQVITHFNTYLSDPKDNPKLNFICWFYKGYAHAQISDWKDAAKSFAKSMELDPNNELASYNYGVANYRLTNWKEAKIGFTKAIEANPVFADAFAARAKTRFYANDLNNSIQDYFRALKIKPQADMYVYMIGITFMFRGNTIYNGDDTSLGSYYMYIAQQSQPLPVLLKLSEDFINVRSL